MIFDGPILQFALAVALLIGGIALILCGVNVCWTRFARKPGARKLL